MALAGLAGPGQGRGEISHAERIRTQIPASTIHPSRSDKSEAEAAGRIRKSKEGGNDQSQSKTSLRLARFISKRQNRNSYPIEAIDGRPLARARGVRIEKSPLFIQKFPRPLVRLPAIKQVTAAAEEDEEEDERRFGVRGTMTERKNRTDSNRLQTEGERERGPGRARARWPRWGLLAFSPAAAAATVCV